MAEFTNKGLVVTVPIGPTKITMEKTVRDYYAKLILESIDDFSWNMSECESPIEQLMCLALNHHMTRDFHARKLSNEYEIFEFGGQTKIGYPENENAEEISAVEASAELTAKKYRVDFIIELADNKKQERWIFAIECDSQQHHLTEERFHVDRERDRELLSAGIITLRYTGKEIVKDPSACAQNVFKTICQYVNR